MSRTRTPNPIAAGNTQVESPNQQEPRHITATLRLRGEPTERDQTRPHSRRIRWAEDVVDNEGQGKKSSKVCCIYHKPREVGESSSESDSSDSDSSSSDPDSDVDNGGARRINSARSRSGPHDSHSHPEHGDGQDCRHGRESKRKTRRKPNAYERIPKNTKKGKDIER